MATQDRGRPASGGWGVRWYHAGFALAFGVGAAVMPPAGVVTMAGWVGGAAGRVVASLLVAAVVVAVVRAVDDWRPGAVADPDLPDSRLKYAVFVAVALQLFVVGLGVGADVSADGMLFLAGLGNLLVAGAVALDVAALRKRGLAWDAPAYGYAVAALVAGFVAGLAYWRARGRKRATHAPPVRDPRGGQHRQGTPGSRRPRDTPGGQRGQHRQQPADGPQARDRRSGGRVTGQASTQQQPREQRTPGGRRQPRGGGTPPASDRRAREPQGPPAEPADGDSGLDADDTTPTDTADAASGGGGEQSETADPDATPDEKTDGNRADDELDSDDADGNRADDELDSDDADGDEPQ